MNSQYTSDASADRLKRVFVAGVFDMNNYGDLLFPLIASFRLRRFGIDVVPVAPTAAEPSLLGAMKAVDIRQMMCGEGAIDAVLIGGGYIVHHQRMDFLKEYQAGDLAHWAATGLWLGATLAGAIRDVPVVWNAPGVLHLFTGEQRRAMAPALRASDYLSVRDQGSAELLAPPDDVSVHVVPDTVAELARMWPRQSLVPHFRRLVERKGVPGDAALLVLHIRNRSAGNYSLITIGEWIDEFAGARGFTPILLAIGQSHDDGAIARELSRHLRTSHVLLDDPLSLQEIAAAIANSRLLIGASLHGYITSAAYDVPSVLVARPTYRKFGGFLEHTDRHGDLVRDWSAAFAAGSERLAELRLRRIPEMVFDSLDAHWEKILSVIANPSRKERDRDLFLRSYLQHGVRADGPGWALQAFLSRAPRSNATSVSRAGLDIGGAIG